MQINLGSSGDEVYAFEYDDEPDLEILIAPLDPLTDEQCTKEATVRPPMVNGRFRRQLPTPEFNVGLYQRNVFVACVKGWQFKDPSKPALKDQHGEPILYSEANKVAISRSHIGLVRFGFDIATALGEISAEQVRREREAFRGAHQVPPRLAEPEL